MSSAIHLENVSKQFRIPHREHGTLRGRVLHPLSRTRYEEFNALDDVSVEIERGEFFGIIGRNGSGKSTLLKLIAGIYRSDAGTVRVDGSVAPFIELGVGFNPELSGRDNVFINGALLGLSARRLRERYASIVEFAELERFMDLKLRNFSSGMQVRLAFSIALEAGAEILLTDEVLAVGDDRFQRKCFDVFRERKAAGDTVLFVSHDMSAMIDFCDRSMLLDSGRVELIADTRTVVSHYRSGSATSAPSTEASDAAEAGEPASQPASIVGVTMLAGDRHGDALVADRDGEPPSIAQGDDLTIRIQIAFTQDFVDPIVGLVVRDRLGKMLVVSNTAWTDAPTGACRAGEVIDVDFMMPVQFAAGTYAVTAGIVEAGPGPRLDLREDAAKFRVSAALETGGVFDPPLEVRVARDVSTAAAIVSID